MASQAFDLLSGSPPEGPQILSFPLTVRPTKGTISICFFSVARSALCWLRAHSLQAELSWGDGCSECSSSDNSVNNVSLDV